MVVAGGGGATAGAAQVPARRQSRDNLSTNPRTDPNSAEPSSPNDRLAARPSNPAELAALTTAPAASAASDEPQHTNARERLGNDVKAAGKGDCVKGEYSGTGMGILSLPFLALAAARGACAQ